MYVQGNIETRSRNYLCCEKQNKYSDTSAKEDNSFRNHIR